MSSTSKACCFAHDHMTCAEYGLWTLGRELSYKKNVLYFDGRNMAKRFSQGGKTAMYRLMKRLIDSGWFVVLEPRKRKSNGQWSAHALRVLSHDQWTETHGAEGCKMAEPDKAPVPNLNSACPEIEQLPVPPAGHSFGKTLQSGEPLQSGDSLVERACPEFGNGSLAYDESPTSPIISETEAMGHHVLAASPGFGTGPVLPAGQVESICEVVEHPPVSPPVPKRRTPQQLTAIATVQGVTVEDLLSSGKFELAA